MGALGRNSSEFVKFDKFFACPRGGFVPTAMTPHVFLSFILFPFGAREDIETALPQDFPFNESEFLVRPLALHNFYTKFPHLIEKRRSHLSMMAFSLGQQAGDSFDRNTAGDF